MRVLPGCAGILCYGRNEEQGRRALDASLLPSPRLTERLSTQQHSSNEFSLQLTRGSCFAAILEVGRSLWFWLFPKPVICAGTFLWLGRTVQLYSGDQMISLRQQQLLTKGVTDRHSCAYSAVCAERLLGLRFRADGCIVLPGKVNDWGYAVYAEMTCGGAGKKFGGSFRVSYFNTGSWDSRIYMYESDVLYGFSVPALYGKGFRSYINMRYAPFQSLDLWVRFACTAGGSFSCESKVQVRFRF